MSTLPGWLQKPKPNSTTLVPSEASSHTPCLISDGRKRVHSQMECFIVLGRPVVGLGLGGVLALLVAEVRADQVHLHQGPEHACGLPLQPVGRHH